MVRMSHRLDPSLADGGGFCLGPVFCPAPLPRTNQVLSVAQQRPLQSCAAIAVAFPSGFSSLKSRGNVLEPSLAFRSETLRNSVCPEVILASLLDAVLVLALAFCLSDCPQSPSAQGLQPALVLSTLQGAQVPGECYCRARPCCHHVPGLDLGFPPVPLERLQAFTTFGEET